MPSYDLKVGDVVVYVPNHANGLITHKDSELGFITGFTNKKDAAFCRYFRGSPNSLVFDQFPTPVMLINRLRTLANSEVTPITNLVKLESYFERNLVFNTMRLLGYDIEQALMDEQELKSTD